MIADTRPIHLFYKKDIMTYLTDAAKYTLENELERRVVFCESWQDLSNNLKLKPESICFFHEDVSKESLYEVISMIETLSRLISSTKTPTLTLGVGKNTRYNTIKSMSKTSLTGIVPARRDFGFEETLKGLRAQWAGIPYWPRHIIEQLDDYPVKPIIVKNKIDLTPRQTEILDIIVQRGASNKAIARMLNITESTVKLHMSGILKKYGVRNRTQLALFARDKALA
jgi:DNA-binding NarL/FixJ family response regulator